MALRPTPPKHILTKNLAEGRSNWNKRPLCGTHPDPPPPPTLVLIPYKQGLLLMWCQDVLCTLCTCTETCPVTCTTTCPALCTALLLRGIQHISVPCLVRVVVAGQARQAKACEGKWAVRDTAAGARNAQGNKGSNERSTGNKLHGASQCNVQRTSHTQLAAPIAASATGHDAPHKTPCAHRGGHRNTQHGARCIARRKRARRASQRTSRGTWQSMRERTSSTSQRAFRRTPHCTGSARHSRWFTAHRNARHSARQNGRCSRARIARRRLSRLVTYSVFQLDLYVMQPLQKTAERHRNATNMSELRPFRNKHQRRKQNPSRAVWAATADALQPKDPHTRKYPQSHSQSHPCRTHIHMSAHTHLNPIVITTSGISIAVRTAEVPVRHPRHSRRDPHRSTGVHKEHRQSSARSIVPPAVRWGGRTQGSIGLRAAEKDTTAARVRVHCGSTLYTDFPEGAGGAGTHWKGRHLQGGPRGG